jgi:uncharacterized protein YndB with AHSA1/START domain
MGDNKPNDKELVFSRVLSAPREAVWDAWTSPEKIKRWWGPKNFTAPHIDVDLRVGGKYNYCMHGAPAPGMPAQDFWSGGVFKEIVPNEKIVVTDYFSDKDGNKLSPADFGLSADFPAESTITITFTDEGDRTRLSIVYALPDSAASREAMLSSGMEEGWNQSLDKLAESLR